MSDEKQNPKARLFNALTEKDVMPGLYVYEIDKYPLVAALLSTTIEKYLAVLDEESMEHVFTLIIHFVGSQLEMYNKQSPDEARIWFWPRTMGKEFPKDWEWRDTCLGEQ